MSITYAVQTDSLGGRWSKGDRVTAAELDAHFAGNGVTAPSVRAASVARLVSIGAILAVDAPAPPAPAPAAPSNKR